MQIRQSVTFNGMSVDAEEGNYANSENVLTGWREGSLFTRKSAIYFHGAW